MNKNLRRAHTGEPYALFSQLCNGLVHVVHPEREHMDAFAAGIEHPIERRAWSSGRDKLNERAVLKGEKRLPDPRFLEINPMAQRQTQAVPPPPDSVLDIADGDHRVISSGNRHQPPR